MKLKDILARELKVWPEGSPFAWQDYDREVRFSLARPGNFRASELADDNVRLRFESNPKRGVTRAEWQAAVEALKAEQESEPVIDWSKQPEEFPLWLEGTTEGEQNQSGWYRKDGEVFTGEDTGQWRASREGQFFTVHHKPVNQPVVAEQAAELKWPDGAEFMGTTKEGDPKVFYRNVGGDYEYRSENDDGWNKSRGTPLRTPLIPRPAELAVEWDGVGVPPTGTVCEVLWNDSRKEYLRTKVFGVNEHGQPIHRFEEGPKKYQYQADALRSTLGTQVFRPIRTQEQIAEDVRMAGLNEMIGHIKDHPLGTHGVKHIQELKIHEDAVRDLWEAGYRKQVAE